MSNNSIEKGQETRTDTWPKRKSKWANNIWKGVQSH